MQDLPANHDIERLRRGLQYVRNFRVAIDGGAHKGIWSREMALHFETVYAFEPVPDNYKELSKHIPLSYNVALGQNKGVCGFSPGTENTGQWHVDNDHPVYKDIPIHTLDSYGINNVDFLKLDVEGFELFALRGATETILNSKPVIMIEENYLSERYGVEQGVAGQYLESLGYQHLFRTGKDHCYVCS